MVTFQREHSLDEAREEGAAELGIKKRDIIVRGIRLAVNDPHFKPQSNIVCYFSAIVITFHISGMHYPEGLDNLNYLQICAKDSERVCALKIPFNFGARNSSRGLRNSPGM